MRLSSIDLKDLAAKLDSLDENLIDGVQQILFKGLIISLASDKLRPQSYLIVGVSEHPKTTVDRNPMITDKR